jgi:hypothetical protein
MCDDNGGFWEVEDQGTKRFINFLPPGWLSDSIDQSRFSVP